MTPYILLGMFWCILAWLILSDYRQYRQHLKNHS